ncbi:MAG: thioredoxin-dependent thiol peroxidase [Brevibacterium sp.]|uniref:thioredoxin-dependent thiol peroxidase n=1 Tax=unclassified Brevibacterium TaxID=2614124 RepID=UPI001E4AD04A|nr:MULTISPECIES: thioredoxin-dependent thiol peroxidase [unclassified Brevibacterium]MCD1287166.1 thioredoxin-dependent thiol peroxidase [Brevibacterium sp. CCUG 69071]MDK8436579.1 thioredoxin-dependent thiol peroxidase [Brevibacterium sp. H-BE7]
MTTQLSAGDQAPDFSLADANGTTYSKADFAGQKVILYFYPKAATPGCTTEACDFRDNLSSLAAAGFQVLGVSPDDAEALKAFAADESLTFPLLSDPGAELAKAYGSFGEKTIGDRTFEGTLRSTFVIDEEGVLTSAEYNVDAEGHVARLRKSLGA